MEGYRIIFHGCGDYCNHIPLDWAPLKQPHKRSLLGVSVLPGSPRVASTDWPRPAIVPSAASGFRRREAWRNGTGRVFQKGLGPLALISPWLSFQHKKRSGSHAIPPVAVKLTYLWRNEELSFKPTGRDTCLDTCALKPSENLIFLVTCPHESRLGVRGRPPCPSWLLPSPESISPAALGHIKNASGPPSTPAGVFGFLFFFIFET